MPLPPLIDAAQFTDTTGIELAPAARAAELLDQASAVVRNFCKWHIAPVLTADEVTLDGSGAVTQLLPSLNVVDVVSVTEKGELVDAELYEWSRFGLLRRKHWRAWTDEYRGMAVVLDHGYEDTPAEVATVVAGLIARSYASPSGAVREQIGQVAVTHSQFAPNQAGGMALLEHEKRILARFWIP